MSALPRRHRLALAAVALLIGPLSGCGGLLPQPPQRPLYRASPSFAFPTGLPHVAAQLLVAVPTAPSGLDTRRVALTRSPVSLDYFADAEWTDRVPFLVQAALVEGFEKSGAVAAVGPEGLGLNADFVLDTVVTHYEAAYAAPDRPPRIDVGLNLKLVQMPQRRIVAQTALAGDATAAVNTIPAIVQAFGVALGRAVERAVSWTVSNPALSASRGSVQSRTRFVHPIGGPGR